jgi:hypothetical protein
MIVQPQPDGIGSIGYPLSAYSLFTGIPIKQLLSYIWHDRIYGARKHPLTRKWWVYPPAIILR